MPLGYPAITETKPVLAYIGLGANLGEPAAQLRRALAELAALDEVEVLQVSGFYLNPPLGPQGQPWYVNAVAQVRTRLTPEELLRALHRLETILGRVRGERWGPRVIDLDLLLYDGAIMQTGAGPAPPGDAPAGLCPGAAGGDRPGRLAPGS